MWAEGRKSGAIFNHLNMMQTHKWFKRTLFINGVWAGGGGGGEDRKEGSIFKHLSTIQTLKRVKRMLFVRTKHNLINSIFFF